MTSEYTVSKSLFGGIGMNALELTGAVTALANAIARSLTIDEMALVASIFVQLGDTLATIAAANLLCKEKKED